jgi:threonine/homoserine/homoserine lactone efflux protein
VLHEEIVNMVSDIVWDLGVCTPRNYERKHKSDHGCIDADSIKIVSFRIGGKSMDLYYLIKGIIIGFVIAAPVGPIGLLCIQRTLIQGRLSGFVSGLGAALADTVYGCIAGFGFTMVSQFLIEQQNWIRFLGGLLLIYLGGKSIYSKPAEQPALTDHRGLVWNLTSTFLLTIMNPMTILFFVATFSAIGGIQASNPLLIVFGVTIGSALWWLILSSVVSMIKRSLSLRILQWIHYVSGLTIIVFGLYGIWSSNLL